MTLELKPDYGQVKARYMAFWEREIIDRPPVCVTLPRAGARPYRGKAYASLEEKWLDIDGRIEEMEAGLENTEFLYDSLPVAWPNLGPEIFSAWCGCPYGDWSAFFGPPPGPVPRYGTGRGTLKKRGWTWAIPCSGPWWNLPRS